MTHATEGRRVPIIDALRGLAALMVALYHGRESLWVGLTHYRATHTDLWSLSSIFAHLSLPIRYGYGGVLLFFVLSGYCIHSRAAHQQCVSHPNQPVPSWKLFWWKRMWRLYPAYIFALLFTWMGSVWVHQEAPLSVWLGNLFYLQNTLTTIPPLNDPFWTLAVEIQLYLLYPILIYSARRWGLLAPLLISSLVSALAVGFDLERRSLILLSTFAGWITWTLGFLIAEWEVQHGFSNWKTFPLLFVSLLSALLSLFVSYFTPATAGVSPFLGISCACLLIVCIKHQNGIAKQYPYLMRIFVFLGVISYSLYLFHRPVLILIQKGYQSAIGPIPDHLGIFALGIAICILVSSLIYRLIEAPGIALGKRLYPSKRVHS